MRTSAAGSKPRNEPRRKSRGFTLIELLVVVAIIAIGTAGVSFALRDSQATKLEREGQRLAALFEAARAQSRATGVPVRWYVTPGGFHFDGAQAGTLPEQWLSPTTQVVQGNAPLVLGPEPIIGQQSIVIAQSDVPGRQLRIATDGLRPFRVSATDAGS
jgi:general secretion pathway protein H